jgi:apolipoprotein D and lipocalin family protein
MRNKLVLFIFLFAFSSLWAQDELKTVPSVDLNKYMGTWYEIARLQFPWEVACAHNTTTTYTKTSADTFDVDYQCQPDEKSPRIKTARGHAKVVDTKTNAKMKFTFTYFDRHEWVFNGDYWIIQLAPDYSYAVASSPKGDHVIVLSRTPSMSEDLYQSILDKIVLQLPNLNVLNMLRITQDKG